MEILGGIALALVLLGLVGLITVAAIPLMLLLGLLTEMSFKRVFFVSFALALFAPILVGVGIGEAVQDGSLERELREGFGEVITLPDDRGSSWGETLSELQAIQREVEQGQLTEDQAETRVRELFSGDNGVQLDLGDDQSLEIADTVTIEAN